MKYLAPQAVGFPQGDFTTKPQVRIFADYSDPSLLQTDINAFLDAIIPDPDFLYAVLDVEFTSSQRSNNNIRWGALIHYILVEQA